MIRLICAALAAFAFTVPAFAQGIPVTEMTTNEAAPAIPTEFSFEVGPLATLWHRGNLWEVAPGVECGVRPVKMNHFEQVGTYRPTSYSYRFPQVLCFTSDQVANSDFDRALAKNFQPMYGPPVRWRQVGRLQCRYDGDFTLECTID